ncbi:MAG: cold shock domain-containing protein [Paracoccaceae bacterium]
MDQADEIRRVTGRVKWFDPVKGFGFVVVNSDGPDILLHANVLRNFGQSSVSDGAGIDMSVQETERGVQALEVHSIAPPEFLNSTGMAELPEFDAVSDADIDFEPARVKWFDKAKGFGFANVFGSQEDIFVHVEVLRRSGFADLQPGEAIGLKVVEGKRGHMASSVTSWDSAKK